MIYLKSVNLRLLPNNDEVVVIRFTDDLFWYFGITGPLGVGSVSVSEVRPEIKDFQCYQNVVIYKISPFFDTMTSNIPLSEGQ